MQQFSKDFLDRPMSRGEFMKHLGMGLVLLFGGGVILQYFQGISGPLAQPKSTAYGVNTYGGTQQSIR